MNLFPCPFCSKPAALWTETDGNDVTTDAWVECDSCHAQGPKCDTEDQAGERWNVPGALVLKLMRDASPVVLLQERS